MVEQNYFFVFSFYPYVVALTDQSQYTVAGFWLKVVHLFRTVPLVKETRAVRIIAGEKSRFLAPPLHVMCRRMKYPRAADVPAVAEENIINKYVFPLDKK